ncbi:MAG TPA: thrombospondin type 3 repeat-containing protein [bacterium]|nr:thrombospondin type 3 repeat-containing protein [bacterium]
MKRTGIIILAVLFAFAGCTIKQTPKDNENTYDNEVTDKDSQNTTDETVIDGDTIPDEIIVNDDTVNDDDDGWGGDDTPDEDEPQPDFDNQKPDETADFEIPDQDEVVEFTGTNFTYAFDGTTVTAEMTAMDGTNEIKFFKASKPSLNSGIVTIKFTNDFDEIVFTISASELTSATTVELDGSTNVSTWNRVKELYGNFTGDITKTAFTKSGSSVTAMTISGNDLKFKSAVPVDPENDDDVIYPDDDEKPDFDAEDYSGLYYYQNSDSYTGYVNVKASGSIIKFTASESATRNMSSCPSDYCFTTSFSSPYGNLVLRAAISTQTFPALIDLENDGYSYIRWITGDLQYGHFLGIIRVYQFEENGFPYFDISLLDMGSEEVGFVKDAVNDDSDGDGTPNAEDGCPYDPAKTEAGICGCSVEEIDSDFDDIPDCIDNCPDDFNEDQADLDSDGIGNICDSDIDGDGDANGNDNCPYIANSDQKNIDSDELGDLCDDDRDGDTILNGSDNCPDKNNTDQLDEDSDGKGNVCETCPADPAKTEPGVCGCGIADTDSDNDGFSDCIDNCPDIFNKSQLDSDDDGTGDACDDTPFGE